MVFVPIILQILCIKISIYGNWNELYQSELLPPDDNCSIHSDMFKELYKGVSLESLLQSEYENPGTERVNLIEAFRMKSKFPSITKLD